MATARSASPGARRQHRQGIRYQIDERQTASGAPAARKIARRHGARAADRRLDALRPAAAAAYQRERHGRPAPRREHLQPAAVGLSLRTDSGHDDQPPTPYQQQRPPASGARRRESSEQEQRQERGKRGRPQQKREPQHINPPETEPSAAAAPTLHQGTTSSAAGRPTLRRSSRRSRCADSTFSEYAEPERQQRKTAGSIAYSTTPPAPPETGEPLHFRNLFASQKEAQYLPSHDHFKKKHLSSPLPFSSNLLPITSAIQLCYPAPVTDRIFLQSGNFRISFPINHR